ncbi:hypothetical protein [Peribacillus muralis]|uniref:hypothetical protein n=1 Tax=Peribacillus muralis TaxID=264697 RepID=UPI00366D160D
MRDYVKHRRLKAKEAHVVTRKGSACSAMKSSYKFSQFVGNRNSIFVFSQSAMKRKAARLLREMRVYVRHRRLKAEEAHGPPLDKRVPAVQ